MLAHEQPQCVARFDFASFAPDDELGNVESPTSNLAAMYPPLTLADALRKLALREVCFLTQIAQKARHGAVDQRPISFRWHVGRISRGNPSKRFKLQVFEADTASRLGQSPNMVP